MAGEAAAASTLLSRFLAEDCPPKAVFREEEVAAAMEEAREAVEDVLLERPRLARPGSLPRDHHRLEWQASGKADRLC